MHFIEALKKSKIGKAQRIIWYDNSIYSSTLSTIRRLDNSYNLTLSVISGPKNKDYWERYWKFNSLTDLFAASKEMGITNEIIPNASNWIVGEQKEEGISNHDEHISILKFVNAKEANQIDFEYTEEDFNREELEEDYYGYLRDWEVYTNNLRDSIFD